MSTESPPLEARLRHLQDTIERLRARGHAADMHHALLVRSLVMVGRALQDLLDEAMRPTGLSEGEFRILMQLYSQPGGTGSPGELCAGLWQSPANVTRLTDQLVARGLISRVPSEQDRRRMVLAVTPAGDALVRTVVPNAFEPVKRLFAPFPEADRAQMLAQVMQLVRAIDAMNHPSPAGAADAGAN